MFRSCLYFSECGVPTTTSTVFRLTENSRHKITYWSLNPFENERITFNNIISSATVPVEIKVCITKTDLGEKRII
ncbi:hypothetical protein RchiOBHm_Chr2g0088111 [Rosa chinensis]|uniref:Uncharacterized protein n=1 Tax=Rosa chinensis TaxID=74649 RepID=A0A2P6RIT2_ROSCH|nr:hypothetical protein RchiOBHm_Chr2g0088111 [Rosa chinensis]